MKHVHLIGIGGTGLSAIAKVLLERGYTVSGSDRVASPLFKAVTAAGARTFLGHAAEQIAGADLVIRSSAIPENNPEVLAAKAQDIPVMKRAEFLDELIGEKDTLAVAGTHGKTTTTGMLIWMLDQLGTNPSFIAGGMVNQLDCNARADIGQYFAIEADEYDSMFLGLSPKIAVITNIEHDHPDCFPTEADYRRAFINFLKRVRKDGLALICVDDPRAKMLMEEMKNAGIRLLGYGTNTSANYQARNISLLGGTPQFTFHYIDEEGNDHSLGEVQLHLPGQHNVLNGTAALAAIHQLGLPVEKAVTALSKFTGTGRRFEILGEVEGITVIDDYGHHPTEIAATLAGTRTRFPEGRIWAVWQPHTYSRTKTLEEDYLQAFDIADKVLVLKIYAAREIDPGYSAEKIAKALPEEKALYIEDFESVEHFMLKNLVTGDVVIFFSAGDATEISKAVFEGLEQKSKGGSG